VPRSPGSILAGTIPGWPDEFTSGARLTFDHVIGKDAARWWQTDIFDRVHLFPSGFAEALSDGLPGDHSYVYRQIDAATRSIRLEMTGASSLRIPIWLHGQELLLQKEMVYESAVLIGEGYQGEGLGRKIASNVYNMAKELDLSQITLDARMTGKYFWAKLGFLPDHGSWEFRLRDGIRAKLASLGGQIGERRRGQIMHLLDNSAPDTIRAIASLRDQVPSTTLKTPDGRPKQISLGMALLAEAVVPWYGVLNLRDRTSTRVFEQTVKGET
jgi:hypothetical protein